jgi:DsbC/DsbD-like thiol-disulfide interchange protein
MSSDFARLALLAVLGGASLCAYAIEVVSVRTLSGVDVKPGASTRIAVQVVVKPGYHVQANPVDNPSLIPITLKIDGTNDILVGEPRYPTAKRLRLAGDDQDLLVYDGTFTIVVPLQARRNASARATVTLTGSLRYQACDDSHCLFPVTLPVLLDVVIQGH